MGRLLCPSLGRCGLGGVGALPRWAIWAGYFLSFVSSLAILALLTIGAAVCLPVARFLGFLWLIVATAHLSGKVKRVP
jgi:hypothetical protein